MGTRADFYIGKGKDAKWIGSYAYDGYPNGIPDTVSCIKNEKDYENAVTAMIERRKDGTLPRDGWPWAWNNSHTTDYAYTFHDGDIWVTTCCGWIKLNEWPVIRDDDESHKCKNSDVEFPDMSHIRNMATGSRSGFMIFSF